MGSEKWLLDLLKERRSTVRVPGWEVRKSTMTVARRMHKRTGEDRNREVAQPCGTGRGGKGVSPKSPALPPLPRPYPGASKPLTWLLNQAAGTHNQKPPKPSCLNSIF